MFLHKKAMLCFGLVVGSVYAAPRVCVDAASNQRIVDAFVKVALSNEAKVQAMNFLFGAGMLCGEQIKFVFKAVMNEVQPQDAQRLLVLLDKTDALVLKGLHVLKDMPTRTPEQQFNSMAELQYDAETILFDLVEFAPAFEKYQTTLEQTVVSEDNQAALSLTVVKVLLAVLHDVRAIIEQKARS